MITTLRKLRMLYYAIGCVVEAADKSICKTKNGELQMRKIFIADDSGYKVEFPLWKKHADLEIGVGDILLIRNASVSEFQGRNISATDNTKVTVNPRSLKETVELSKWMEGYKGDFLTYVPKKEKKEDSTEEHEEKINKESVLRVQDIMNTLTGASKKEELSSYSTIKCIVTFFQHSDKNFYAGCSKKTCKKKLIEEENSFFCTSCNQKCTTPTVS